MPARAHSARTAAPILALAAVAFLGACSSRIEERASIEFEPVYLDPMAEMPVVAMANDSIYAPNQAGIVSGSQRARQVGDILTVAFTERFQATKNQNASTSKTSEYAVTLPPILGAPLSTISGALTDEGLAGGSEQAFSGTGGAAQSNSLTGRMSVSVVRILPGGNLEIHGQKKLTLNNGDEYIRVRGVVRPQDISVENVVLSERIAHAEIKYIGAGDVADVGKQGWLHRLFNTANPM